MKTTASPVTDSEPSHTLAQLQELLGEPDKDLADTFFHGTSEADLVTQGQHIASARILTDVRRIYPTAFDFWARATAAQRTRLRGFTPALLGLAVARSLTLQGMLDDHNQRTESSGMTREGREQEAKEAFDSALLLRDQAISVLRPVVAGDRELTAQVESAVGSADTPENLAAAMKRLGTAGSRALATKKGPIAARAKLLGLDAAYVQQIQEAGDRLATATEKTKARSGGARVTQGALDLEDGKNLLLMGHIMEVFEAAHDLDPTIPRLVPIATRRLFLRARKVPSADKAPSPDKPASSNQPAPNGG
ncbi:MAG: hypothetical protein U0441_22440 [Polyangiaceae bacterium]